MEMNLFCLDEYEHSSLFANITHPWEALAKLKSYIESYQGKRVNPSLFPKVHFEDPDLIFLAQNVDIEPGAYIQGPCILGEGSQVRQGAYIRGGVVTGKGCVIGHATEVKNSILLNQTLIAHFNYVGDSILGSHVNLGAGVKCANMRLDKKNIRIRIRDELIETGLNKLGAIVGDGASLGCNSVLSPGCLMGKNSSCDPLIHIQGFIPEGTRMRSSIETCVES